MKIATLTPTRGDRPELMKFCYSQISKQTIEPEKIYAMISAPISSNPDLTRRVREGYEWAKADGMDWVVIMEDDDSYSKHHIERYERFMDRYDFIGDQNSLYYNIRTRRYQIFRHPRRASLFTTAFRVSALDRFKWPSDDTVFLDIKLWNYAKTKRCKFVESGAVGIKGHGFGMSGGKGHVMKLRNHDSTGNVLRTVTGENYSFYENLVKESA